MSAWAAPAPATPATVRPRARADDWARTATSRFMRVPPVCWAGAGRLPTSGDVASQSVTVALVSPERHASLTPVRPVRPKYPPEPGTARAAPPGKGRLPSYRCCGLAVVAASPLSRFDRLG